MSIKNKIQSMESAGEILEEYEDIHASQGHINRFSANQNKNTDKKTSKQQ